MRRHIASLVVRVNGHVQTHQFAELLIVVAQHVRKVARPIQFGIGLNVLAVLVGTAVDVRSHTGQARNQIHRILIRGFPVLRLVYARRVGLGKLTFRAQSHDAHHKLRHGVRVAGQGVNSLEHMRRNDGTSRPVVAHTTNLIVRGQFIHQNEVEQAFGKRLRSARICRQKLLQFGDAVSAETNAFLGIQLTRLTNQGLHAAHALVDLTYSNFTNLLLPVFGQKGFHIGLCCGDFGGKMLFNTVHQGCLFEILAVENSSVA